MSTSVPNICLFYFIFPLIFLLFTCRTALTLHILSNVEFEVKLSDFFIYFAERVVSCK